MKRCVKKRFRVTNQKHVVIFWRYIMKKTLLIISSLGMVFSLHADRYDSYSENYEITDSATTAPTAPATADKDRKIAEKVRKELKGGWFSEGYDKIAVEVVNGNVTLRGTVNSLKDKKKIEEKILKIRDVRNIDTQKLMVKDQSAKPSMSYNDSNDTSDDIYAWTDAMDDNGEYLSDNYSTSTSQQNMATSDEQLAKKAREKLAGGWFSRGYDNVNVKVNNGNIILYGTVKTKDERVDAEKRIRDLDGASSIINQISVLDQKDNRNIGRGDNREMNKENREMSRDEHKLRKEQKEFPQDRFASPTDEQLNKAIREKISIGWLWDSYKDIQLNTTNGIVTINGEIKNRNDEQKILKEVQKVPGVRSVISRLDVSEK